MGYPQFNSIEDLVFNRSFREWVLTPSTADAAFWHDWVQNNPDKAETINQAKAIIYALQFNLTGLSDESVNYEISRVLQKISQEEEPAGSFTNTTEENSRIYPRLQRRGYTLAATAFVGLLVIAFFLFRGRFQQEAKFRYTPVFSGTTPGDREQINNADTTLPLTLPDGSKVYLERGSRLHYAIGFSGSKREVFLTGAALFSVVKNASKPFFVYTSSVVTKVLGTRFRVQAYPSDKKAVITVQTGKVSVFKAQNFDQSAAKLPASGGVVLVPNQEVVYSRDNNELNKTLTAQPQVVLPPAGNAFRFDATPVRQVFKVMQDTYNIPIVYDEELMAGCSLSATMGDEPFYDKLNLICKALDVTYEIIDGQIIIVGKGCKPAEQSSKPKQF